MNRVFLLCIVGVLFLQASCKKSSTEQNRNIELGNCLQKKFKTDQVSLCFDKVLQDSRCPIGSMCIWSGYALVQFTFHQGGQSHDVKLSTLRMSGLPSPDTLIAGYKIHFINLYPHPGDTPATTRVEVEITK